MPQIAITPTGSSCTSGIPNKTSSPQLLQVSTLSLSLALDLLKNVQVEAIIGPLTSSQAEFVADIGNKTQVPILSFSATSASLSPAARTPYFIRTAVNDFAKNFGWREVVSISEDTDYGAGIFPNLVGAVQLADTRVPATASDDQITAELYKLMTMHTLTRVFVVHMEQALGSRFFTKAAELRMMSQGYAWIITDGMANILDVRPLLLTWRVCSA